MKVLTAILMLSSLIFGMPAIAGAGHDHNHSHSTTPATQEIAIQNATNVIVSLVERDKIDQSWSSIIASSADKKTINGQAEWMVIFINKNITTTDKQKLYVFLNLAGEYIAVNYTGN